ncbi:MAG: ATPase synthesis protein 25 mitochondrial [Pycnora praestabilis]|nr:MAG: ATPase synthesis protein 25 mitochondrial [Pycnora praestabilis]
MVVSKAINSSSRCTACRNTILRVFSSLSAVPLQPSPLVNVRRNAHASTKCPPDAQRKHFSTTFVKNSNNVAQRLPLGEESQLETIADEIGSEGLPAVDNAPIPWYLQLETPQRPVHLLSERQRLPDLPANCPPLLQPILEHISVELGIDDLSLFDLRKLDPPPALGANLVMLLGTARSEKHLHVSADRLCRWLRTNHKLSPFADGLLGRNELKLKMRRKARKMKLLGSVGASDRENADDGIRTGWVCVNIGKVEDGGAPNVEMAETDDFVGFGGQNEGVRIVVQMLTEAKREEIDLEGLWGGMLERKVRKDAKSIDPQEVQFEANYVGSANESSQYQVTSRPSVIPPSFNYPLQSTQTRGFHTSTLSLHPISHRRNFRDLEHETDREANDLQFRALNELDYNMDPGSLEGLEPTIQLPSKLKGWKTFNPTLPPAEVGGISIEQQDITLDASDAPSNRYKDSTNIIIDRDIQRLRNLPRQAALQALGHAFEDFTSPSVRPFFSLPLNSLPGIVQNQYLVELYRCAIEIEHPRYQKSGLMDRFNEMRLSGIEISKKTFFEIFRVFLERGPVSSQTTLQAASEKWVSEDDFEMALSVLEEAHYRGYSVFTEDVLLSLHEAVSFMAPDQVLAGDTARKEAEKGIGLNQDSKVEYTFENRRIRYKRLHNLMDIFEISFTTDISYVRLFSLYAAEGNWEEFWDLWHGIARRMLPRSEILYRFMFDTIASTEDQKACIKAVRTWFPEMKREEPPVLLERPVAEAVKNCLLVIDPRLEEAWEQRLDRKNEWVTLWKQCDAVGVVNGEDERQTSSPPEEKYEGWAPSEVHIPHLS